MTAKIGSFLGLALLLAPASTSAAYSPGNDCAALGQLYRDARTDFPALKGRRFEGASCTFADHKYQCAWSFSSDKYADAEAQVDRLTRCTVGEARAKPLEAKHNDRAFQINRETTATIRGPDSDDGNWTIRLKLETSADWGG